MRKERKVERQVAGEEETDEEGRKRRETMCAFILVWKNKEREVAMHGLLTEALYMKKKKNK